MSAGFDSAIGDPEVRTRGWLGGDVGSWAQVLITLTVSQGQMQATPECFAHLTQLLQVLAGGRICAVLEVTARGPGRASDARVSQG